MGDNMNLRLGLVVVGALVAGVAFGYTYNNGGVAALILAAAAAVVAFAAVAPFPALAREATARTGTLSAEALADARSSHVARAASPPPSANGGPVAAEPLRPPGPEIYAVETVTLVPAHPWDRETIDVDPVLQGPTPPGGYPEVRPCPACSATSMTTTGRCERCGEPLVDTAAMVSPTQGLPPYPNER